MRLIISFAALFVSVILFQLGAGSLGPLDAISGLNLQFSKSEVGILGSAHFLGFFIGCWWAPRLMGSVGHSRAFAAFVALGTIGTLLHMMLINPYAWAVMRILSGMCVAGAYTIIEAWLQAKVTNETRGRAMGVYRVVDITGSLGAQLLISVLEPAQYVSYNILALFCCVALLPLTLTKVEQPETPDAPRLRPGLVWECSPLAAAAVVVSGITSGAFRMVGPVYGVEVGLTTDQIAFFLAAFVLGGALSQYPTGMLADRFDRRWVLTWLSVAAMAACAAIVAVAEVSTTAAMLTSGLFGFVTFPIYSVAAAHSHDFAESHERVELSAGLMFLFAVGAIASPWISSILIEYFGSGAMFAYISVGHAFLIVFGVVRMRARPTEKLRTPYVYAPRTSFVIGRLMAPARDTKS